MTKSQLKDEPLYLPKKDALQYLSLGYKNTLSHVLWFQTINYFGKHYRGDKVYTWLEHMCDLSTAINKNAAHIYEFCALMLSWEIKKPEVAQRMLADFIKNYPDTWRPYYLQGMNSAIFFQDGVGAMDYFIKATKTPNAPAFLARIASKKIAELESPELAIAFLNSMLAQVKEPSQKASLEKKLSELKQTKDKQQ